VPTHERLGTNNRENLQDRRKPAIHLDKEPAIVVREPGGGRAPYGAKIIKLMSQLRVLCFKPQLRLEQRTHKGQKKSVPEQSWCNDVWRFLQQINADEVSLHTGPSFMHMPSRRMRIARDERWIARGNRLIERFVE
jgi:hypothetical protein